MDNFRISFIPLQIVLNHKWNAPRIDGVVKVEEEVWKEVRKSDDHPAKECDEVALNEEVLSYFEIFTSTEILKLAKQYNEEESLVVGVL